jgi:hypothetical protein
LETQTLGQNTVENEKARFYKNKKVKQGQTAYKKSFTESEVVTAETFIASTVKYVC